jgi:hypothetical protein
MKIKIIGMLICIMLLTTFLSVASDFEELKSQNLPYNEKVTSSFDDDVPEWNIGDKWTYKIHDINMDIEENETIHVHLEIDDFPLEVIGDSSEYNVEIKDVNLKGDYHIIIEDENGTIDVEGNLVGTTFNGNIFFTKTALGITKIDYTISGILTVNFNELPEEWNIPKILMAIPIPATITTTLDFSTPYTFLDFPMNASKIWGLPPTNFTVNGQIQSIWLTILNIINNIATAFNYPLLPEELAALLPVIDIKEALELREIGNVFDIPEVPALFACFSKHNETVLAGEFESYNISVAPINLTHALGRIYYSPEVKNIIKISGELGDLLPFITNLEMELKEYQLT